MNIARTEVVTISQGLPIKKAVEKMLENDVRRLPVTSPGTKKLHGMVVSRDIVSFLGGGEKHKIIKNRHDGNFLSAINDSVKLIMEKDAPNAQEKSSISEVAKLLHGKGVGGTPILDKEDKIVGIVTERDFAGYIPAPAETTVGDHMVGRVVTIEPEVFLVDAMEKMISKGFRRLPVVEDGQLLGILTSVDVLKYFGSNEVFKHMASGNASDAMSIEVNEIMTEEPHTAKPKDDLGEVAREMEAQGYGGFPVIEDDELVGIITERDILEILL